MSEQNWSKDEPFAGAIAQAVGIGREEGWDSWHYRAAVFHALTLIPDDMLVRQFRELLIEAGGPSALRGEKAE